jgi:toxin ParE1/3/4
MAAEADLAEIWSYLALETSEASATRFVEALAAHFGQAASMPGSGAPRDQLGRGLRVLFHRAYAIYYLTSAAEVVIVRVLHGARDVVALAERGAFSGEEAQ